VGAGAGVVETGHRPEDREGQGHAGPAQTPGPTGWPPPSWRGPFAKRRAVIPAAGYYEWLPTEDADGKPVKQPYYIHPADGMLSFAGLFELWPDPAKDADDPDRWLWSAAMGEALLKDSVLLGASLLTAAGGEPDLALRSSTRHSRSGSVGTAIGSWCTTSPSSPVMPIGAARARRRQTHTAHESDPSGRRDRPTGH
jgi:SOS response associated peptidase (SRAP)